MNTQDYKNAAAELSEFNEYANVAILTTNWLRIVNIPASSISLTELVKIGIVMQKFDNFNDFTNCTKFKTKIQNNEKH